MTKALAVSLGLALFSAPAFARDPKPAPSKKEAAPSAERNKGKGTAKAGEACKIDEDCDQSGREQSCSKSKCEAVVAVHPVT